MDRPRFRVKKPKFIKRKKSKDSSNDSVIANGADVKHYDGKGRYIDARSNPLSRGQLHHDGKTRDNSQSKQSDKTVDNVNVRSTGLSRMGAGDGNYKEQTTCDVKQTKRQVKKLPRPSSTCINHMATHTHGEGEEMNDGNIERAKSLPVTPGNAKTKIKTNKDRNRRIPVPVKPEKHTKANKSISQSNLVDSDIATSKKSIEVTPVRASKLPTTKYSRANTFPRKRTKIPSSRSSIGGDSIASSLSETSKEVSEISQHKPFDTDTLENVSRPKSSSPIAKVVQSNDGRKSDPGTVGWRSLASERLRAKISRPLSPLATVIGRETDAVADGTSQKDVQETAEEDDATEVKATAVLNKNTLRKGIVHSAIRSNNTSNHKAPIHRLNATVDGLNSIIDKLTSNYVKGDNNSLNSSTCSLYSENFSADSNSVPDVFASAKRNVLTSSSGTPRSRNQSLEQSWLRNRSFFLRCTEVRRKQHRREWESNKISGNTDRNSVFGQRNMVIRQLTQDLASAKRLIKMQEDEICRLHGTIDEMRESAMEEECYKVEAQVDKVRAENDVKMLEATINDLRKNMEALKQSRKDYISKQESQAPHLAVENVRPSHEQNSPFESRYHGNSQSSQSLHGSLQRPENKSVKTVALSNQNKTLFFNFLHLLCLGESFIDNTHYINRYQVFTISRFLKLYFNR